jgi:hypothetical protein
MGKGVDPKRYQQAVPLPSSSGRGPSPYQSRMRRCHTVCGSCRRWSSEGSRGPRTRGRPKVCLPRAGAGWWITESKQKGAISVICSLAPCTPSSQMLSAMSPMSLIGTPRQPVAEHADELMCPHADRFVASPELRTHIRGGGQGAPKGQGPPLPCPGRCDDHRQHDPASARAADGSVVAGQGAIAIMSSCADPGSPAPFQRFVDHHNKRSSGLNEGLQDQGEEVPTRLPRASPPRPSSPSPTPVPRHCHGARRLASRATA